MGRQRYYIDAINRVNIGKTYYDACDKPHSDAIRTAEEMGFVPRILYGNRLSKLGQPIWKKVCYHAYNLWYQYSVLRQARALNDIHDSDIFVQYGFATEAMFSVVERVKRNGNRIILLLHDMETVRLGAYAKKEKQLLDNTDIVIVHSEQMKERLKAIGYQGRFVVMGFFDYRNDYQATPNESDSIEDIDIVFAGNLSKSLFLTQLHTIAPHPGMHFHLYGKQVEGITYNGNIRYKGVFSNDDIGGIEGNWGLVWDGDSVDTCSSNWGEYLRINAPFKFSLYVAKGLPLIVWKDSAMAYYVKKYNIGICVSSLHEVYDAIHRLTSREIAEMRNNVCKCAKMVTKGMMLTEALGRATSEDTFGNE